MPFIIDSISHNGNLSKKEGFRAYEVAGIESNCKAHASFVHIVGPGAVSSCSRSQAVGMPSAPSPSFLGLADLRTTTFWILFWSLSCVPQVLA